MPGPGHVLRLDREERQAGLSGLPASEDEDDHDQRHDAMCHQTLTWLSSGDEVDAGDVEDQLDEHQDAHGHAAAPVRTAVVPEGRT